MSDRSAVERARLFFALWPSAQLQAAMAQHAQALAQQAGGRIVAGDSMHLTLAFLGEVEAADLARVQIAARNISAKSFVLNLDQVGVWRGGIGWLAPSHVPAQLAALSETLRAALRAHAVWFDSKAFKPHVTLLRNAERVMRASGCAPLEWRVDEFALRRSRLGRAAAYEYVERWRLEDRGCGVSE